MNSSSLTSFFLPFRKSKQSTCHSSNDQIFSSSYFFFVFKQTKSWTHKCGQIKCKLTELIMNKYYFNYSFEIQTEAHKYALHSFVHLENMPLIPLFSTGIGHSGRAKCKIATQNSTARPGTTQPQPRNSLDTFNWTRNVVFDLVLFFSPQHDAVWRGVKLPSTGSRRTIDTKPRPPKGFQREVFQISSETGLSLSQSIAQFTSFRIVENAWPDHRHRNNNPWRWCVWLWNACKSRRERSKIMCASNNTILGYY